MFRQIKPYTLDATQTQEFLDMEVKIQTISFSSRTQTACDKETSEVKVVQRRHALRATLVCLWHLCGKGSNPDISFSQGLEASDAEVQSALEELYELGAKEVLERACRVLLFSNEYTIPSADALYTEGPNDGGSTQAFQVMTIIT